MRRHRGFTLVESLSVTALTVVFASVAAPPLASMVQASRVSGATNDLLAGLFLTRSEAIKRRVRAVMCRSADGASCAAAGGWQQGWIVFADANGDGTRAAGETLLHVQPPLAGSLRLKGTGTLAKYVSYAPNGATKLVGGGFQAGTFTVCSESAQPATGRQVVVNANGRPRTQKVRLPSCS